MSEPIVFWGYLQIYVNLHNIHPSTWYILYHIFKTCAILLINFNLESCIKNKTVFYTHCTCFCSKMAKKTVLSTVFLLLFLFCNRCKSTNNRNHCLYTIPKHYFIIICSNSSCECNCCSFSVYSCHFRCTNTCRF